MKALKRILKRSDASYRLSVDAYFALMHLWMNLGGRIAYVLLFIARFERRRTLGWIGPKLTLAACDRLHRRADRHFAKGDLSKALRRWGDATALRREAREVFYGQRRPSHVMLSGRQWTIAIGHIALLGPVIKLAQCGRMPRRTIHLYVDSNGVANSYLLSLLREHVQIVQAPVYGSVDSQRVEIEQAGFEMVETCDGPTFLYEACCLGEQLWAERPALLNIPAADAQRAATQLASLGILAKDWFVGLHVRGPGYRRDPDDARNASISNYAEAVDEVLKRGGKVVWLGDTRTPLPDAIRSKVINYADSPQRSPMLDVFLCARSRFFVGTTSGISHVPALFGVPTLFTNTWPPFARPWRAGDVWIPKSLVTNHGSKVSASAMFALPQCAIQSVSELRKRGFSLIENDRAILRDAFIEMLERAEGDGEDAGREERHVDALLSAIGSRSSARIAKAFLRQNAFVR